MLLKPVNCWIDSSPFPVKDSNTMNDLRFSVRTATSKEALKKAMFDLAFYMKLTKATNYKNLEQIEWSNVLLWHIQHNLDPCTVLNNKFGFKVDW